MYDDAGREMAQVDVDPEDAREYRESLGAPLIPGDDTMVPLNFGRPDD